ncbi:MAG: hypothetical protein J2P23_06415 [Microlunatus sp.]|nr:hypothetical protein [Microlunatus sp.]
MFCPEFVTALTHWAALIPFDIPNPPARMPKGLKGIETIMSWAKWVALAVCVLGLVAAGAMMAVNARRGEGGEHVGRIGMALGGVIVISAASTLVGFLS